MQSPDLQRATTEGAHFLWLLEVVLGNAGNVFANQIVLQSDKPAGVWFAPDGEAASWRPGWWRISQEPKRITVCFAWRVGVEPKIRTYMRHRAFDFDWTGGVSTGHFKLLRVLNPEGRWSRLLPVPLQEVVLSQAGVVAALREDLASQELSEAGTEGDGPPLVPTDLPSAVTQVAFHTDRRLASIVLLTEPSCAASGSEEGQFAIVTGVQGPVSSEAPAQEVSGTLSRQDRSLSSVEEF